MELYFHSPYMSHGVYFDNFTFTLAYIYMPTHVHTYTHPTHICTVSTFAHTHFYKHVCMCSDTPLHTHTHTHTYLFAHAHLCPKTHMHISLYSAYTATQYQSSGYTKKENCHVRRFCPTLCHSTKLLNHV